MINFFPNILMSTVAAEMRRRAWHCVYTGTESMENRKAISHCAATWAIDDVGVIIIFTRDIDHHTAGMFRNPDYERCYHLSLSFRDAITGTPIPFEKRTAKMLAEAFFKDDVKKLWIESPKTKEGKRYDVWHYRLFCNERWHGILPRKEVYSAAFTELGWKSFSEVHCGREPFLA